MTLGYKIRKYRTLKALTQTQLGSMVKLTGDRIRQYENIEAMIRMFHVPIKEYV